MGRGLFLKYFRIYIYLCKYWQEFQIRAQLLTDTVFTKMRPNEEILWFQS